MFQGDARSRYCVVLEAIWNQEMLPPWLSKHGGFRMTGSDQKVPRASWKGDWRERVRHALSVRSYDSLLSFVKSRPGATLKTLVEDIGASVVSPVQLKWLYVEEVLKSEHISPTSLLDLLDRCLGESEELEHHAKERKEDTGASEKMRKWRAREAIFGWAGAMHDPRYIESMHTIASRIFDEINDFSSWKSIREVHRWHEIFTAQWTDSSRVAQPSMNAPWICIDTNLMIEISTITDLNRVAGFPTLLNARDVLRYRHRRARTALVVAWACHKRSLITFSLRGELDKKLKLLAPASSFRGLTPWFFAYYLKDFLLADWRAVVDVSCHDAAFSGNDRDRYLIEIAKKRNAIVITNESKPDGAIAQAAKLLGVATVAPSDWVRSFGYSEDALAEEMQAALDRTLPAFMALQRSPRTLTNCCEYYETISYILQPPA